MAFKTIKVESKRIHNWFPNKKHNQVPLYLEKNTKKNGSHTNSMELVAILFRKATIEGWFNTPLEHTPSNLYQQVVSRESFHSWVGGLTGMCCSFFGNPELGWFFATVFQVDRSQFHSLHRFGTWPRRRCFWCYEALPGFLGGENHPKLSQPWWGSLTDPQTEPKKHGKQILPQILLMEEIPNNHLGCIIPCK